MIESSRTQPATRSTTVRTLDAQELAATAGGGDIIIQGIIIHGIIIQGLPAPTTMPSGH